MSEAEAGMSVPVTTTLRRKVSQLALLLCRPACLTEANVDRISRSSGTESRMGFFR